MKRVFPDRKIVELPPTHPIFRCFYQIDEYPQTPGLGSFLQGRTWEKGGFTAHLRAIQDDTGRAMVLINWNTDMGDGWEWSNAAEYPGLREVHRAGLPDADQRNHLFADSLMHMTPRLRPIIAAVAERVADGRAAHPRRDPQGHRRPGRGHRRGADGAVHRRPLPDHRRARAGQDAADQDRRADPRPVVQAHPVHAGPDAGRHHRHRGPRRRGRPPRRCAS